MYPPPVVRAIQLPVDEDCEVKPSWEDASLAYVDGHWQRFLAAPRRRRHAILRRCFIVAVSFCIALFMLRNYWKAMVRTHKALSSAGRYQQFAFSHNDEEQGKYALDMALGLGFGGIEVDIWLAPVQGPSGVARRALDGDCGAHCHVARANLSDLFSDVGSDPAETMWTLRVGHTALAALSGPSLQERYLDPLMARLDAANAGRLPNETWVGLYASDPHAKLILTIDLGHAEVAWPYLVHALEPLRDKGYLTTYDSATATWTDAPIQVVGTGNTPLAAVYHQSPRYVFYDAPLFEVALPVAIPATAAGPAATFHFSGEIAPMASAKLPLAYHLALLLPARRPFNPVVETMQLLAQEARRRGAEPRWWGHASQPGFLRERTWKLLKRGGAGWVGGDDLPHLQRWLMKWEKKQAKAAEAVQAADAASKAAEAAASSPIVQR